MANGKLLQVAVREFGVAEGDTSSSFAAPIHYVNKGDTIYNLSIRYQISQSELRAINGLSDNTIIIGTPLRVAPTSGRVIEESRILQYAKECGLSNVIKSENDAWCSVWMNWVAMKAGCKMSRSARALSWLDVGVEVKDIYDADVVVYFREPRESGFGHVGIPFNYTNDKKNIWTFGGNQSNQVCVKPYPVKRLIQFRKIL